jgi:hypothetical protein
MQQLNAKARISIWGVVAAVGVVSMTLATPDHVGEETWLRLRWPLAVLSVIGWVGFLLSCLVAWSRSARASARATDGRPPLSQDTTVVASPTAKSRIAVGLLLCVCVLMTVRESGHQPFRPVLEAIWAVGAAVLAWQFWNLWLTWAVFSPTDISWRKALRTFARPYRDLAEVEEPSSYELRLIFNDGTRLRVTSDMTDLGLLKATLADRREADLAGQ